jgi:hypothetical protein
MREAAGHLLGILRGPPPSPEVIAPTERRIQGIETRRSRRLEPDGAIRFGIPLTSVPWTIVDLSARLSMSDLARACHEAGVRYGTTPGEVEASLAKRPNITGARKLCDVLGGDVDGYRYHQSRHAWEHDRRREREAHARGDELRRCTHGDVFESPGLMLAELQRLLPRSPGR